jgi:hypothetical protein
MTQAPLDPPTTPAGATSPGGETHERDWAALELEVLGDLARIGNAIAEEMNQGYRPPPPSCPPDLPHGSRPTARSGWPSCASPAPCA